MRVSINVCIGLSLSISPSLSFVPFRVFGYVFFLGKRDGKSEAGVWRENIAGGGKKAQLSAKRLKTLKENHIFFIVRLSGCIS